MDRSRTFGLLGLVVYGLIISENSVMGLSPLVPPTLNDTAGNIADNESQIAWTPVPAGKGYASTASQDIDERGLTGVYDMVSRFIDTLPPTTFPYDMIDMALNGKMDQLLSDIMALVNLGIGFGLCFVFGILFVFIMPIVGCCFCCCRLCGRCGGKNRQTAGSVKNCPRIALTVVLAVSTTFVMVPAAISLVANDVTTDNLKGIGKVVTDNLNDLNIFLNNTILQVKHVSLTNYNFTAKVVTRDLDNIGIIVGESVRDDMKAEVGLDNTVAIVKNLTNSLTSLSAILTDVNTKKATLDTKVNDLSTALGSVKTDIDNTKGHGSCNTQCNTINTNVLVIDMNSAALPSLTSNTASMTSASGNNLTTLIDTALTSFNDIPNTVTTSAASMVTSVKSSLDTFYNDINTALSSIDSLTSNLGMLTTVEKEVNTYSAMISTYDQYRWYGGVGLGSLLMVIAALQFIGLGLGVCMYSPKVAPQDRGCASKSGGNLLMAAVGLSFIFSWLLMLPTSLTFIIGAPVHKFVCQPLQDPNYEIFKKIIDKKDGPLGEGYFLGGLILSNSSMELTIHGVLDGCKKKGAAYTVLKLENLFNLTDMTDYKSKINIESQLNGVSSSIDLSSITVLDPTLNSTLRNFRDAININYTDFITELDKDNTQAPGGLTAYGDGVIGIGNMNNGPAKTQLIAEGNTVKTIDTIEAAAVTTAKTSLKNSIISMRDAAPGVTAHINQSLDALTALDFYIQNNASALIVKKVTLFANRVLGIVDQYVNKSVSAMKSEVGVCTPLWNLYNGIINVGVCRYVIESLNIFWFCLGWALFFFLPSMICSVKLAKYLRPAVPEGSDEKRPPPQKKKYMPEPRAEPRAPPSPRFRNQVGPSARY